MNRTGLTILMFVVALFFAAHGVAAQKPSAARNTKPAPTADALMALERQANDAWLKGDSKFFEGLLSDKFVSRDGSQRMNKAAVIRMIGGVKCDVKTWNLDEPWLAKIDADTYLLSYRGNWDGTCESMKIPSPTRVATVWIRSGDKWQAAFHGENLIVDPKNPPNAAKEPPAKPARKANVKRRADPNTDTLVRVERSVWKAWKAHDLKKLEGLTTNNLSFIDIFGNSYANRDNILKTWSSNVCKVKSVNISDAVAFSLSPTVALLTHIGTANGTCYGEKLGRIYGNSVYVKEGGDWKLAFTMNMPAM